MAHTEDRANIRRFLRRAAAASLAAYAVIVGVIAVYKVRLGSADPPLGWRISSWAEVFYGPAITIGFAFLALVAATRLEVRIADRRGRRHS
jgi:hypothetical protein